MTESANTELKMPLMYKDIVEILPHRYPFLLVDRVVELESGVCVKAYKNVSANEPFFNGHFPGMPVMPGVLQIEALAQTAAVLARSFEDFVPGRDIAYLMSVDSAKFRRVVEPGDRLDLEVTLNTFRRGICKVTGKATVDGKRACEANITAAIRPREG